MSINKRVKDYSILVLGSMILAFGMYNFNYQHNITEGGVLGLILFFKNVFDIPPSITNLVLDLSLFIIGIRYFGREFLVKSILCSFSFSFFYQSFETYGFMVPRMENMFLVSILAGLFVGVGVGLIVTRQAAAGGDDVIALVLNKLLHIRVERIYMIFDLIVLTLSLIYIPINHIIWSFITVIISGQMIGLIFKKLRTA